MSHTATEFGRKI